VCIPAGVTDRTVQRETALARESYEHQARDEAAGNESRDQHLRMGGFSGPDRFDSFSAQPVPIEYVCLSVIADNLRFQLPGDLKELTYLGLIWIGTDDLVTIPPGQRSPRHLIIGNRTTEPASFLISM
jgi:hypothetical protein